MKTVNKFLNSFRDIIIHFKDGTSKRYSCCNADILVDYNILMVKPRLSSIDVEAFYFMEEVNHIEYSKTNIKGAILNICRLLTFNY